MEMMNLVKVEDKHWYRPFRFHMWRVLGILNCQVISHTFSRSKKAMVKCCNMIQVFWIWCSSFTSWLMVDLQHWNSHWAFERRLLFSRTHIRQWFTIHYIVLQTQLVRLLRL